MAAPKDEIFTIEVLNWDDFQHKNGERTYDWFKISNNISDDVELDSLTDLQFRTWFLILALCARYRSRRVKVTLTYLQRNRNVPLTYYRRSLDRFESFQWLKIISGTNVVPQNRIEENRIDTKEQVLAPKKEEGQERQPVKLDFESLYLRYPRKLGKKRGIATCKTQIKTQVDFERLKTAIEKYSAHCHKNKTQNDYIQYFSTFMNSWEDWLEDDAGQVVTNGKSNGIEINQSEYERDLESGVF